MLIYRDEKLVAIHFIRTMRSASIAVLCALSALLCAALAAPVDQGPVILMAMKRSIEMGPAADNLPEEAVEALVEEGELDEEEEGVEEHEMAKRTLALGRMGFRPGKRSLALGRASFRPGKRSVALGRMGFRPGKRSLALGRASFRPGKRSLALGRGHFRPGKRSFEITPEEIGLNVIYP